MSFEREPCSVRAVDAEQIDYYIAKGRQLRAEAVNRWAAKALKSVTAGVRDIFARPEADDYDRHSAGGATPAHK